MFKPADLIIYSAIIMLIIYPLLSKSSISVSNLIRINSGDNTIFAVIDKDSLYTVDEGSNRTEIEVKDRMVRVKYSSCRDKYCEKKGWLKETDRGEIVCMPNKVIISFINRPDDEIDAVTE